MNPIDFYMPAEWVEHERTFIEWPVRESMISMENYELVCEDYVKVAKAIAQFEPVTLIVNEDTKAQAKKICGEQIEYLTIEHNDAWCRDSGPTFVLNHENKIAGVSWQFNAWGGKYLPYDLENKVAGKILKAYQIPVLESAIILEGGSIHVDGEGTLLTTKECLLNKNRNASLSQKEIEKELSEKLNISKIIWLDNGFFGDETDGHVDNVACFAKPGVILLQTCKDGEDANYQISQNHLSTLFDSTDSKNRKIQVIEIPQPPARYYKGERLTLSYLNFYMVNGGIILPVFGEDASQSDEEARMILEKVFPERKIVPVNTSMLITEGGNVHCITQQMPKGIRL